MRWCREGVGWGWVGREWGVGKGDGGMEGGVKGLISIYSGITEIMARKHRGSWTGRIHVIYPELKRGKNGLWGDVARLWKMSSLLRVSILQTKLMQCRRW